MASRSRESRRSGGGGWGYVGGIALSAILHAGLLYLALFVLPKFLNNRSSAAPPSYTVKIVDSLPAGDLATHLPMLSRPGNPQPGNSSQASSEVAPAPSAAATAEPAAAEPDKNAIALSDLPSATPASTPAPIPTSEPTPVPTAEPTPAPTEKPMPTPALKATPKVTGTPKRPAATTKPDKRSVTSQPKAHPKPSAAVLLAKAEPTPSVSEQLAKIRKQLLAQHLAAQKKHADNDDNDEDSGDAGTTPDKEDKSGGGPAIGPAASAGAGFGIGEGTGSAGGLENLDFLLYYRTVQERVRKAWNFNGGSPDLTATVTFSIGADGSLTGVKVTQSSKDSAYDDSVVRAIRKAAPFPPPPEKYRDQFGGGIEALFKLGEMT